MFAKRPSARNGRETNGMLSKRRKFESLGGRFDIHQGAEEILPNIWVSGPTPRPYPETNYGKGGRIETSDGIVADTVPESQSLFLNTRKGIIIISGCGHAGFVNLLEQAHKLFSWKRILAAIGGFHLFNADSKTLNWTGMKMRSFGVENFMGAHCTGLEAVYRLRELAGLSRKTAVVGAVGASFDLNSGINPLALAR